MTPDDYRNNTWSIIKLLLSKDLEWVVREIEGVFREGRLVEKKISKNTGSTIGPKQPKQHSLLGSDEYSPEDELAIVIAAIERALVDTVEIEVAIESSLKDFGVAVSAIEFVSPVIRLQPEEGGGPSEIHKFSFARSLERSKDIKALRSIIGRYKSKGLPDVE